MAGTAFVGRSGELRRLAQVLRGDPDAAPVAVVTGDAGIGKTRLLAEVIQATPDVLVLAGGCLPMSEPLPFGAVADGLSSLTGPSGRPLLDQALTRCAPYVGPQVAALIPALSEDPRPASDVVGDRTRLFAAVRDLLAALGSERRTAVVVEDLHWADSGTLDLLTFLVRGRMPDGTCLVVTSRRDELPLDDLVVDWLASTIRVPGVEPVGLASLSTDDVEVLIASLVDAEPAAAFVADVVRRGEGNPFFTEQLVAAANDVASPLEVPEGVPREVAQMLLGRVSSVSPVATEVAAVLAVAARPLAEPELTACVGGHLDVVAGLRELLDSHLVETAGSDRYRLRHALLEDTVRATLVASQRSAMHDGVARILADRGETPPGEVAAHWHQAGDQGQEARWSVNAARHAEGVFAWREASVAWKRVWDLCTLLPPGEQPRTGLVGAAVACVADARRADDDAAFLALAERALADEAVTSDARAHGTVLALFGYRLVLSDVAAGISALQRAVSLLDRAGEPDAAQAHALMDLVISKKFHGLTTGTEHEELDRAEAIAAELGDLELCLELAADRAVDLVEAGRVEEGVAQLAEIVDRAGEDGVVGAGPVFALIGLTDAYLWGLRLSEGVTVGDSGVEWALERGHRETYGFSLVVANAGECLLLSGDTPAVARSVARFLGPDLTEAGWPLHLLQAEVDIRNGNLTMAQRRADAIAALGYHNDEMTLDVAATRMEAWVWQGRPRLALEVAEEVFEIVRGSVQAKRASRFLALAARAAADQAYTDTSAADRDRLAQDLLDRSSQAKCFAPHPARVLGTAYGTTFHAELARLRREDSASAWRAARDTWTGHGVPHHAAYAGWRLAEQLLAAGARRQAESDLASAYTAAEHHAPLRTEMEGLARRARLTVQPQESAPVVGPDENVATRHGLTARELDVLRLLGTGATNAEIGRRLYMSPKTASVHVSAIIRKLGVSGRVQAATVADRMGLLSPDGPGQPRP